MALCNGWTRSSHRWALPASTAPVSLRTTFPKHATECKAHRKSQSFVCDGGGGTKHHFLTAWAPQWIRISLNIQKLSRCIAKRMIHFQRLFHMNMAMKHESQFRGNYRIIGDFFLSEMLASGKVFPCAVQYMHSILGRGWFCTNYWINASCDRVDLPVALMRC